VAVTMELTKVEQYTKQTWEDVRDPLEALHEDISLTQCEFGGCSIGLLTQLPSQRTVVRRVRATSCSVDGGSVGPVFFDDVHITNLRTAGGGLWLKAPLFRHVVLEGKIGTIVLVNERWGPVEQTDEVKAEEAAFAASTASFYAGLDWALDISKAEFRALDWRLEMPSRLVRRDPETQFVARRERVLDRRWETLPLHMIVSIGLSNFLEFGQSERIFAAPKASKRFKEELESYQLLRKEGIFEPE